AVLLARLLGFAFFPYPTLFRSLLRHLPTGLVSVPEDEDLLVAGEGPVKVVLPGTHTLSRDRGNAFEVDSPGRELAFDDGHIWTGSDQGPSAVDPRTLSREGLVLPVPLVLLLLPLEEEVLTI